jgi:hypothetical protein
MAGNAIHAMSEALDDLRDLSSDDLDAVSGGWFATNFLHYFPCFPKLDPGEGGGAGGGGGQNDPAQMFQQILQQMTQGQA